ncbi:DUF4386 domain-containing protein [Mucilaginibacter agri]|uniref:DUF4386 family protein n=1 Tax=Mucilaginibacter agri TaxID=2695265 RepID=A0A965ZMY4_9SPHI|nr:DUF4386 domain-containing protein [Mucilaginibacter agri]NCD72527.1 DUF4386 family protein [Mucilaginibacter agri]
METIKRTARTAGLFYLVIVFGGIFYLRYVPVILINRDNMALTVRNLRAHITLFRFAIVAEIVSNLFYLLLVLTFYKLFQQVSKRVALVMVLLVGISIVMDFVNLQNRLAILSLIDGGTQLRTFSPAVMQDQILVYINIYRNGIRATEIFWGGWLFPLGYLIYRSKIIPKIIGIFLMVGCFGYVTDFIGSFFFLHYSDLGITNYVIMPASIGELSICFWLLIMGARTNPRQQ